MRYNVQALLDVPRRQVEFSGTTRPRHRRRSDASELRMQHSMCLCWAANSCMKLRELIQTIRPSAMRGREETLYENPWPNNLAVREVLTNVLHLPDGDLLTRSRQGNGGEVRVAVAAVVVLRTQSSSPSWAQAHTTAPGDIRGLIESC